MVVWSKRRALAFCLVCLFALREPHSTPQAGLELIMQPNLTWNSWQVSCISLHFSKWLLRCQMHGILSCLMYKNVLDFFFSVSDFQIIFPTPLKKSFLLLLLWDLCWWAVVVRTSGHRIPEAEADRPLKREASLSYPKNPPCGIYH